MTVSIGGVAAGQIQVVSSTVLFCAVPAYQGEPKGIGSGKKVPVVLTNLGPPPAAITKTDGFTYARTSMARSTGVLVQVIRELVLRLRREVIDNIAVQTDIDYDPETGDSYDIVDVVKPPGIALLGPAIEQDLARRFPIKTTIQAGDYWDRYLEPKVVTLAFTAAIITTGDGAYTEMLNLAQEFSLFFHRSPTILVWRDPDHHELGQVEVELWLDQEPSPTDMTSPRGVRSMAARFSVKAVPLDWDGTVDLLLEHGASIPDGGEIDVGVSTIEEG